MRGLGREEKLVIVVLLGLALGAGALLWWQGRAPGLRPAWTAEAAPAVAGEAGASSEPGPAAGVIVHVAGAVTRPGVYSLPAASRAVDAVEAAGGVTAAADSDAVNLARPLQDGERLYIPTREETRGGSQPWASGAAGEAGIVPGTAVPAVRWPLDLNRATTAELDALPGIGPTLAARIVLYRTQNGPFAAPEELLNVSGIGQKKYEELAPLVTVR